MSERASRRIAVIGAGITGLAAAHRLCELALHKPWQVVVFEATDRPGGIVSTHHPSGFVIERGPDSFITDKPEAVALCGRLGLSSSLIATRPQYRRSFVVRRGRLAPTPDGFQLLGPARLGPMVRSPLLSPMGKLRLAFEPFVPPRTRDLSEPTDESLASFVTRRFGREVFERIAQPMVGGIYGADPTSLSLRATFPRFLRMEAEHGSVIRGLRAAARGAEASGPRYALFASLTHGMQTLTDTLAARLPAGTLRLSTPVSRVAPAGNGTKWSIESGDRGGAPEAFDAVVLAVSAAVAGPWAGSFDPPLAAALGSSAYGSSVNVALAFHESDVGHPMDGAGFVVPAIEGLSLLGGSFVHRKFEGRAPVGQALLRAFLDERALSLDDEAVVALVRREIGPLLGIERAPLLTDVARWPMAMPHYRVGHLDRMTALRRQVERWPGLALAGSSYDGVGLPDCIRSGEAAAEIAAAALPGPRAHTLARGH